MNIKNGFSLIELNFAIVLIGLTVPVLLGYFINNTLNFSQIELSYQAASLAKSKMEEIIGLSLQNSSFLNGVIEKKTDKKEYIDQFVRETKIFPFTINSIKGVEAVVSIHHPKLIKDVKVYRFFCPGKGEEEDEKKEE